VTEDGWYPDPTGRHSQRLFLSGVWTRRVRDDDGTEQTEGEDHSGAMTAARRPSTRRSAGPSAPREPLGWSVERPSWGLAVAVLGALLAVFGFTAIDWASGISFEDTRRAVDLDSNGFNVVTQAYMKVIYLPLLIVTVLTGLLAPVGRMVARVAIALGGVLGGVGLVAVVIWIESGGVGTGASRGDALPVLVVMVAVGVVSAALGVGAFFEGTAVLARGLAATLAGLAVILHVFVVEDVFSGSADSALGPWACAIGYTLLAIAPVLPYRRILHT
jgi:hypothetical protein